MLVLTSTPVVSQPVRELPQPALSDMAGYAAAESIMRSAARARRGDPSMR